MKKKSFTMRMPFELWQHYINKAIIQSKNDKRIVTLSEVIIKTLEKNIKNGK